MRPILQSEKSNHGTWLTVQTVQTVRGYLAKTIERLVDVQAAEDLAISVVTVRTPDRQAAAREQERTERRFPVIMSR